MNGQAMYADVQRGEDDFDVGAYAPLVKRIAFHLHGRLPPSVQVEDLIQAGMIGLLEAMSNFDANQGASFETYAGIRIRGSMLDEIRVGDWTPRAVRRQNRELVKAIKQVEDRKGGEASDAEVAEMERRSAENRIVSGRAIAPISFATWLRSSSTETSSPPRRMT